MPGQAPAWEFSATGTRWRLYHSGGLASASALDVALAVERDEARWSRFRVDSEVSELGRHAGEWFGVSGETLELLAACVEWTERTGGVFQPLVGEALKAWGYEHSILERPSFAPAAPNTAAVTARIELDRARSQVRIPADTSIDLGGIGKSWIAARAARLLANSCQDPALLIDAGGDLVAVRGAHLTAIEAPKGEPGDVAQWITLPQGHAVATSGHGRRRWVNGDGSSAHHLIDPATGAPGPETHATVVAPDPVCADVSAKVLALRPEWIEDCEYPARVTSGDRLVESRSWAEVRAVNENRPPVSEGRVS